MFVDFKPGLIQSPPDHRDYIYGQMVPLRATFPSKFSLESGFVTPIHNQGKFGTCVGHAAAAVKEWQEARNYPSRIMELSPLFVYEECKKRDGIPDQEGTYPRTAMAVLKDLGICKESSFPYSLLQDAKQLPRPSESAYSEAKEFVVGAYARIQTLEEIKQAIMRDGPVLAGIIVFENFLDPEPGGFIPMPGSYRSIGGHAITVVGWDDELTHKGLKGFLRARNSWGADWGDRGYCWIPYDFFHCRAELGIPYWIESWSSVDVILPPKTAQKIVMWIDRPIALVDGTEVILDQPPVLNKV